MRSIVILLQLHLAGVHGVVAAYTDYTSDCCIWTGRPFLTEQNFTSEREGYGFQSRMSSD